MDITQNNKKKTAKIIWSILGAVTLGAIGSGIWDVIAKPGLSFIGRTLLLIVTFGSKTIKDSAYGSAALDPTSLSSEILVMFLPVIPVLLLQYIIYHEFFHEKVTEKYRTDKLSTNEEIENKLEECSSYLSKLNVRKRKLAIILIITLVPSVIYSYISTNVVSQAVLIWRVFNANIIIVAPYVDDNKVKMLKSSFSSMSSKDDYEKIDHDFIEIANKYKLQLRNEKLW